VALPWHTFMLGRYPDPGPHGERGFLGWILGRHILERASGPIEGHTSGWGPLFYLHVLAIQVPFVFALGGMGLAETWRTLRHKMLYQLPRLGNVEVGGGDRVPLSVDDRMRLLIVIWLLVTFLVPTCFGTKIAKYSLPAVVPFCILAGVAMDRVYRGATSNETNVSLFAWVVLSVIYWQTHAAHHSLEALLGSLWDWRPLTAGELVHLTTDGSAALLRVTGAGVIAFGLGVGVWLLRNRLAVDHSAVGRVMVPVILIPMLVISLWRQVVPSGYEPGKGRPYPLAAEEAFQQARAAAGSLDFELADRVVVVGDWHDNFQMAFYLRGANYGVPWGRAEPAALSRIEQRGGQWVRLDVGHEQNPVSLEDPLAEVGRQVVEARNNRESVLVVLVLYDRALAEHPEDVHRLRASTLEDAYGCKLLSLDARGWGYAILYRDFRDYEER
jgi:hypothetical protein